MYILNLDPDTKPVELPLNLRRSEEVGSRGENQCVVDLWPKQTFGTEQAWMNYNSFLSHVA